MEFRISDTFTDSLTKLTNQEQKAAKTTAFDLQLGPANPGLRFHKLDRVKDPNFWSVSVNMDLRLIVHRTTTSLLLCYADRHDKAYAWAHRRKIERHPKTGAAQLVEVRETVEEVRIQQPAVAPVSPQPPRLFANIAPENRVDDDTRERGYRLVGDVEFDSATEVAGAITPVPGGVGPMTIAMLMKNTLRAAEIALAKQ